MQTVASRVRFLYNREAGAGIWQLSPEQVLLQAQGKSLCPTVCILSGQYFTLRLQTAVYHSTILEVQLATPFPVEERVSSDRNNLLCH